MSKRQRNQLPYNLPQLQNLIKRDPDSYKDEFLLQYDHFQANLKLFHLDPTQESKPIQASVMFLSQVCPCYPTEMREFPLVLMDLLRRFASIMEPEMRLSLCRSLMVLRSKDVVDAVDVLELFFELFRVQDKLLRKTLYVFIVSDLKRVNTKHRNNKVNKTLQNFMFKMVKDSSPVAAKLSLDVMVELYHKHIWNDPKTVNVVVTACFSPITKIMVAAIVFFLGKGEDEDRGKDSSDSDDDEPEAETVKKLLLSKRVSKKTKYKHKKTERALAVLKKHKKKKKGKEPVFSGLHLINDPQDFAEKLFKRLERSKEKFEVKLLMMNLISKLIGVHQLFVFNFYPFLQRYLQPHQKDVTKVLVYLAQACHELIPPDIVLPCVRAVTDNFITERNSPEVMAVGLNTVREISIRCPLVMTSELLQDLAAYKGHRDRSVVMASRSLIQTFRVVNPQLLHKKDRGRPTEVEQDRPKEYGEMRPAEYVPGMELLHLRKSQDGGDICDDGDSDESEDGEDEGSEGDSGDVSGGEDCDDEYLGDDGDSGEHVSGGEDDGDKCLGDDGDGDGDGSDSGEEETSSMKSDVDERELDGNGSLDRLEGTNDEKRDRVDVEESRKLASKSGDINSDDGSDNDAAADDDDFDGDDDDDNDDDSGRDADSVDDCDHFGEHDDKQMPSNSTNDSKGKKTPRKGRKQPISKDLAKEIIDKNIEERKELAATVCQTRFLTEEDFENIRLRQLSQKLEPSKSRKRKAQEILEEDLVDQVEDEKGEFVTLRDIAFVHKKKKLTREERLEQIKSGRQGREKYGFKKRRLNPHASTTNQEKAKKKAFSMIIQKKNIKRKQKRSFREKQIALRNSLIKRQKSKR